MISGPTWEVCYLCGYNGPPGHNCLNQQANIQIRKANYPSPGDPNMLLVLERLDKIIALLEGK